jgi:hypothetical protein
MARWSYKTSTHNFADMPSEPERVIECDDKAHCLVHDLPEKNLEVLEKVLNEEGDQGWELIQCHYHAGDLFCLWKKEEEEA